jgi:hypothetical protein
MPFISATFFFLFYYTQAFNSIASFPFINLSAILHENVISI